jgi:hypothetical protein
VTGVTPLRAFQPEVSARQRDRIAAKYRGRSPSGDARPGKSYRAGLAKGRRFLGEAQKGQSLSARPLAAAPRGAGPSESNSEMIIRTARGMERRTRGLSGRPFLLHGL